MFTVSRPAIETINGHAREEYPSECCGLLTVGPAGVEVHPCENIQDRLHAHDPKSYPRDSRIAYYIDPQKLYDIVSNAESKGGRLLGIYHSHVDTEAYFSEEDKGRALFGDEPAYPDVGYLVISVYNGDVAGRTCFMWSDSQRDFVEIESVVGE